MKRLLLSLLILVFSSAALAAEPIVHEGKEGIFIEGEKAKEATAQLKEYPALKKQKELLELEVEKLKQAVELKEKRIDVEQKIAEAWKLSFENAQKEVAEHESKRDVRFYVYVGLFAGGTIVGAAMMYGASVALNNIR